MLTIRNEQFAVFSDAEVRKFEAWVVAHLQRFFPAECAGLGGDPQLRDLVRHGIGRAAVYGVTRKADVSRYVDLMMLLGKDFDVDGRFEWASAILANPGDGSAKMAALQEAAKDHFRRPR
jgi:hypothetical protein